MRCLKGSLLLERIDVDTKGFILCKFQLRHHGAETTYENQSINLNDLVFVLAGCETTRTCGPTTQIDMYATDLKQ